MSGVGIIHTIRAYPWPLSGLTNSRAIPMWASAIPQVEVPIEKVKP